MSGEQLACQLACQGLDIAPLATSAHDRLDAAASVLDLLAVTVGEAGELTLNHRQAEGLSLILQAVEDSIDRANRSF